MRMCQKLMMIDYVRPCIRVNCYGEVGMPTTAPDHLFNAKQLRSVCFLCWNKGSMFLACNVFAIKLWQPPIVFSGLQAISCYRKVLLYILSYLPSIANG